MQTRSVQTRTVQTRSDRRVGSFNDKGTRKGCPYKQQSSDWTDMETL